MSLWKTLIGYVSVAFAVTFVAHAEEIPPPVPAALVVPVASPVPGSKCVRYSKIRYNDVVDAKGAVRMSYYLFVVHWYVDGKHYYLIPAFKSDITDGVNPRPLLEQDATSRLYRLTWKFLDRSYCVEAPFFERLITPYDYELSQRPVLKWFQGTYPTLALPTLESPIPTPIAGG